MRPSRGNTSGNVAVIFGLVAVPLIIAMGMAVDFSRGFFMRHRLQAVLDASLLTVARDMGGLTDDGVAAAVTDYIHGQIYPDHIENLSVEASQAAPMLRASASGTIPTYLLAIANMGDIEIGVSSAVSLSQRPSEYALVIDTTGSMVADMPTLRAGAQALVDIVTINGKDPGARIAVVPFVGAVNIGNGAMQEDWLDKYGLSAHAAQTVRGRWLAADPSPACAGASVTDPVPPRPAMPTSQPYTYERVGCYYANPMRVSNWQLFQSLSNVRWAGCVETRPEPYDIDDTPPGSDPDTRWVPFFALDELDAGVTDASGNPYPAGANNYLPDDPIPGTNMATSDRGRTFSVLKYQGQAVVGLDETPPMMNGPNKNCPDPILPLTNDPDTIGNRISQLVERFNGGTNTAEGVAWGLRVLSPTPPFTEGAAYGDVRKIMVVFSDGTNAVAGQALGSGNNPNMPFISEYTSYGYSRFGRFATQNAWSGGPHIDDRMDRACTLAKSMDVEIHVIAMGASADALARLAQCASSPDDVIAVPRGADLEPVFEALGRRLMPLTLVR